MSARNDLRIWALAAVFAGTAYACYRGLDGLAPFPCAESSECPRDYYCLEGVHPPDAPDAVGACYKPQKCDLLKQDCTDPARAKCTRVALDHEDDVRNECVPAVGQKGQGEACENVAPSNAIDVSPVAYGVDDCAPGLACARHAHVCRKYCKTQSDCPGGHICVDVGASEYGFCAASCTLGGDCGAGRSCAPWQLYGQSAFGLTCEDVGQGAEGDACDGLSRCGPGLTCADTCTPLCDDEHPCALGRPCASIGLPKNGGICGCHRWSNECPQGVSCKTPDLDNPTSSLCLPDGSRQAYETCSTTANCGPRLHCLGRRDVGLFACYALCDASHGCGGAGYCIRAASDELGHCGCRIRESDCGSGRSCKPNAESSRAILVCVEDGATPANGPCTRALDCSRDTVCWGNTSKGYFCRQTCDATHPCASGTCKTLDLPGAGGVCEL